VRETFGGRFQTTPTERQQENDVEALSECGVKLSAKCKTIMRKN